MIVIYWKYMNTSLRTPFLLLGTVAILVLLLPVLTALAQQTESEANLDASASASSSLQTKVDAGNALNSISDAVVTDSTDTNEYGDSYNEMPPRDIDKPSLMPGEDGYIPSIREGGRTVEAGDIPETQQQQNDDNDGDLADVAATATGDLKNVYPPGNKGTAYGVGIIAGDDGNIYVFQTPQDNGGMALEIGNKIFFELDNGQTATGLTDEIKDGDSVTARKRPGRVKYGDITLERNFVEDPAFITWLEMELQEGKKGLNAMNVRILSQDENDVDILRGIEKSDIRRGIDIKKPARTIRWSVEEGVALEAISDTPNANNPVNILKGKLPSINGGGAGKATFKSKLSETGLSEEAATKFLAKLDRIKIDVVIDEEINGVDGSTSQWSLHNISISADDLKDWTDTDRKSYQALKNALKRNSPEYASLVITEHLLNDDRIESITSDDTSLKMKYRARIKLFGFIPLDNTVTSTLQLPGVNDVVWDMRVVVNWPWYARFFSTKESADTINETVSSVAKKAKFKAGKALAETVK